MYDKNLVENKVAIKSNNRTNKLILTDISYIILFSPARDTTESTAQSSALALVGCEQSAAETAISHSHIVTLLGPSEHFSLPGMLCGLN